LESTIYDKVINLPTINDLDDSKPDDTVDIESRAANMVFLTRATKVTRLNADNLYEWFIGMVRHCWNCYCYCVTVVVVDLLAFRAFCLMQPSDDDERDWRRVMTRGWREFRVAQ
jgi:hypothetical protein